MRSGREGSEAAAAQAVQPGVSAAVTAAQAGGVRGPGPEGAGPGGGECKVEGDHRGSAGPA